MPKAMWLVLVVVLASCERAAPRRVKDDAGPPPADAKVYEPIDLVLAIDVSKSMEEPDVPLDRLEETKRAARAFVAAKQPQDRIAIVIFALQEIANATGGTLYRASDPAAFDRAMQELRARL